MRQVLMIALAMGCRSGKSVVRNSSLDESSPEDTSGHPDLQDTGDESDPEDTGDEPDPEDTGDEPDPEDTGDEPDPEDTGDEPDPEDTGDGPDPVDPCADRSAGEVSLSLEDLALDWWEGESVPSEAVALTIEDIDCAHLEAHSSEDWLSVTVTTDTLTLSLNTASVHSGNHRATATIWDTDTDTVAAEVTVNLAALVRPADETSRNVLVIGVDGMDGDELRDISVPVMERLMQRGFSSYAAHTQLTEATSSGPGWTSFLTGVEASVHGVSYNGGYDGRDTDYPSFLYRAKHELGLATAASIQWSDIWDIMESDVADGTGSGDMEEVADTMSGLIRSGLYQVHFVHLDDLDGAGHAYGYLASVGEYSDTAQEIDEMIGEMIEAILDRPEIATEHWMVLVSADHGGDSWGSHGTMTSEYQTIPLIIAGPGLAATELADGEGSHMDIHPTVIDFLGLDSADYGLDGTSWWERERDCDDGSDDDADGLVDCDDPDCALDAACIECPLYDLDSATGISVVDDVLFEESALTGSCGGAGSESTYAWTAPETGRYSFDTVGGLRDTVLYALSGDCGGEELACSEDIPDLYSGRSGFSIDVEAGEELSIVVDSFATSTSGASVLSIHPYTSSCPDGILGTERGTWSGTHTSFDQAHLEACPPAVGNLELTWTAPEDGTYTYSSEGSDFDTVIYVLDGCGGSEVTCNDDYSGYQSQVSFSAEAGEVFIIGIGGFNASEGSYVITID
jgi:hypothetical protein